MSCYPVWSGRLVSLRDRCKIPDPQTLTSGKPTNQVIIQRHRTYALLSVGGWPLGLLNELVRRANDLHKLMIE